MSTLTRRPVTRSVAPPVARPTIESFLPKEISADSSAPPSVWQTAGATATTATFSPPANSLLVVWLRYNTGAGNAPTDPSVTDSLGVHLTYTLRDHNASPDITSAVDAAVACWTAPINAAPGPMTVSATDTDAATGSALLVQVFTHPDGQPGVGAVTPGASAVSSATTSQGYTATANGSRGVMGWVDWNGSAGTPTAGAKCTVSGGDAVSIAPTLTFAVVLHSASQGVAGNAADPVILNHTATTDRRWIAVEITPPAVSSNVDVNADQTTHTVVTGDASVEIDAPDQTAPALSHTAGNVTATVTTTDTTAPANSHTTHQPTTTVTTNDTTAPAIGHQANQAGPGVGDSDDIAPAIGHQTHDVTATVTTNAGTAVHTHQAGDPTTALAVNAGDAVNTHQAFDATVSTASLVNVNAELTNHALLAGDVTATVTTNAGTTNHAQTTLDATTAISAPAGTGQHTHDAQTPTAALSVPDVTAPAIGHQTHDAGHSQTTTDTTAPAISHQTFDATVSTAVIVNANAGETITTHTAGDPSVRVSPNAEHAAIAHQTFDAVAQVASTVNVNAGDAATTHQAQPAVFGLGKDAQSVSHALTAHDATVSITTQAGHASIAHSAFDAQAQTELPPVAYITVDTGLSWVGDLDGSARGTQADGMTSRATLDEHTPAISSAPDGSPTVGSGIAG